MTQEEKSLEAYILITFLAQKKPAWAMATSNPWVRIFRPNEVSQKNQLLL
jgi:hypothetical protein